ncbi:MAG: tetratricopeptide repeat protein [Alicyclobacillaceae bacterium]|nr:tetratricopeptide repeat protein [Alicyclobacillaceae bacterium]
MAVTGKTRNVFFYSVLGLSGIALLAAYNIGLQQDRMFLRDYQAYETARNQMAQGQFAQAEPLLKDVLQRHPDSYAVLWRYAACQKGLGRYEEADRYYTAARNQRPFLLKDQRFLLDYGDLLLQKGDVRRAREYLQAAKKANQNPELTKRAEELLLRTGQG